RPRAEKANEKPDPRALAGVEKLRGRDRKAVQATFNNRGGARAVYGKLGRFGAPGRGAARTFLAKNADVFKLRPDLADLSPEDEKRNGPNSRVTFQQKYRGIKVHGGRGAVAFDGDGEVTAAGGDYFDDVEVDD